MFLNIILLFTVLIILTVFFKYSKSYKEGFDVPVSSHLDYMDISQTKFNPFVQTVNATNPAIPVSPDTSSKVVQAINPLATVPTSTGNTLSQSQTFKTLAQLPDALAKAQACEATPDKTCSAFDDPKFAANCGMSFDSMGIASSGRPFTGGLYISDDNREEQARSFKNVQDTGSAPYDPYKVYQPTIGQAASGKFSISKDSCIVVKEKVDCETKQSFKSPNCTQCYTSQSFSRVDPATGKLPSTLNLFGNGMITIASPNKGISLGQTPLDPSNGIKVELPADAEGSSFTINVYSGTTQPTYISGYLEGSTARGTFKIDIVTIIQSDTVTNSKARIGGSKTCNGFRCFSLVPGNGQKNMALACLMPFTFINMYDGDALACDNGPIITKAESATFLESDPCYGKANSPGNYKLECLQSRWTQLGGTQQGTGYPTDKATSDALQKSSNGNNLDIDDIADTLAVKSRQAYTGEDATGKPLSIPDWNTVSMYMTGVPINTPCDGPANAAGPLSQECLSYLYTNQGGTTHIGPTYGLPPSYASAKTEPYIDFGVIPTTYNYPGTAVDPLTKTGLDYGKALSGVNAAKKDYDYINRLANDNTRPNSERADAIQKAYGIKLGSSDANFVNGPTEVFMVSEPVTKDKAATVCSKYDAKVATADQLKTAQKQGADMVAWGWVADSPNAMMPITSSVMNGQQGVNSTPMNPGANAATYCYGAKPDIDQYPTGTILPFNGDQWNHPTDDKPYYLTTNGGYPQTSGPQPSCFSGLSLEQAQQNCTDLGDKCAAISYSIDGSGSGCYKGNVNGGFQSDGNYKGYVKVTPTADPNAPTKTISGRYITLQWSRYECLNLAQIMVYSVKNGPNIITPRTTVTKSSGYSGDAFPVQNFINGQGEAWYNFTHTSCGDIPWITVDLGSVIPIYKVTIINRSDCCQSRILGAVLSIDDDTGRVYISNSITSTNHTYSWLPPNRMVFADLQEDTPYSSMGCWADTGNRAVPPMDGSDPRISGNYQGRSDAINACYTVAKERGMKLFAVQDGGWCAAAKDFSSYAKYGRSGNCRNGKGGGWANDVYQING